MSVASAKETNPTIQRRNRITLLVLLAIVLAVAAGGVLYLRHYGFAPQKTESRFH